MLLFLGNIGTGDIILLFLGFVLFLYLPIKLIIEIIRYLRQL